MAGAIEQVLRATGFDAKSVAFSGGELRFEGSKPASRSPSPSQQPHSNGGCWRFGHIVL